MTRRGKLRGLRLCRGIDPKRKRGPGSTPGVVTEPLTEAPVKTYTALEITDHFAGFKGRILSDPFTAIPSEGVDLNEVATGEAAHVAEQLLPHMTPIERRELAAAALALNYGNQRATIVTLTPADLRAMTMPVLAGDSGVVPIGSERGTTMQMGG